MCTPKVKTYHGTDLFSIAQINGRPVLQPACNRVMTLERCNSLKKKSLPKSPPPTKSTSTAITSFSAPNSPKSKTPKPALKLVDDPNGLNSSTDKNVVTPKSTPPRVASIAITKSKKCSGGSSASWEGITSSDHNSSLGGSYSSLIVEAPGSIAVARREQVNLMQAQRKMRIAHYGRTPSKIEGKVFPTDSSAAANPQEKRCSFITPNSDPLYVAYHDEEWGAPVHDDRMLFELLVLTGAQVGLDWTSILRKRDEFRAAFAGFDIDVVANFNQRQIASISAEYGLDSSRVHGTVDNANCILEIRREFGSFDKYLWGFVNYKPISTNYKSCRKIPVKTSKSETMSKDMVRRGFRYVGPTVMHSFMQAAGLTNDHLITCQRHLQCNAEAH
ncbi:hypothetical protein MRB53_030506 [Persea americana]|uniref:Uncharacterized protein n=1 Tax=Persea americana TaxID=3435 RepID=A0ACC2KMH9_PERAE|nr:hypothetical protein MRB53_030506 [Persea americana]|eukprot:TRINITY_DN6982_c0_g2_i2.p1 TRINITY_DN6982_c0_g2~~TRINITY_DN6982_c0_g2_i2.p1  ORF type:complete len:388 (+),score=66.03 TRINITY_DN6982_c0_g2_i2:1050-2213(+)